MSQADAIAAVEEARAQTLAAGSARIALLTERRFVFPEMPHRRSGGLLGPVLKAAKLGAGRLLKRAFPILTSGCFNAEGFIDFAGRRYMLDTGHSFAELYADGKGWLGRAGRPLATLAPANQLRPFQPPRPLWLLDLLAGVVEVSARGTDHVRGTACRHLFGTTDLGRASAATPGGIAVPAGRRPHAHPKAAHRGRGASRAPADRALRAPAPPAQPHQTPHRAHAVQAGA